jgi:3'-5' exoribonuclease
VSKIFISELKPHQEVTSTFVAADKQLRTTRTGASFVTLRLADRTGEVVGRIWENAEALDRSIPVGGAVSVTGRCETYKGELQLNIQQITPVNRCDADPADFLPVSPMDPEILHQQFRRAVASIKSPPLRHLMQAILADRPLMDRIKQAPAGKSIHHAYLGGLLEHTVSVAGLAALVARHYEELDRDLLTVGALLHDIGKVDELTWDLAIDYSDSGRLLGHMILGLQIVEDKIRSVAAFPAELATVLKHLILSHHGEQEHGAVKVPMTREAFVLHFIDDLDAKMSTLARALDQCSKDGRTWTAYQPALQRFIYGGAQVAPEASPPPDAPAESCAQQLSLWTTSKGLGAASDAASRTGAAEAPEREPGESAPF